MARFPRCSLAAVLLLAGCAEDASGPTSSISYTTLPASVISHWCVRGNRTAGDAIVGTVSINDCDGGGGNRYESWRVRVDADGEFRFAASSPFDNIMVVSRIVGFTIDSATTQVVSSDDDSGPGRNALMQSVTLLSGVDYLLIVGGFDVNDVGTYNVAFTRQ